MTTEDPDDVVRAALARAEAAERALTQARRDTARIQARLDAVRGSLRYRAGSIAAGLFRRFTPRFAQAPLMGLARRVYRAASRRGFVEAAAALPTDEPRDGGSARAPQTLRKIGPVVVVPVFDAADDLRQCCDALARWTPEDIVILIVDDASVKEDTGAVIEAFRRRRRNVEVVRHGTNRGFAAAANTGFRAAGDRDVVLLNSDAMVGPLWLQGLLNAAYAAGDVASVTAFSDNAGPFTIPGTVGACDEEAPGLARLLAKRLRDVVETPTAHGFCTYIRRAALNAVGDFDAEAFPEGYGEENDWSMRASEAGFRHVAAPGVWVRHAGGRSFGARKRRLLEAGRATVDARWPGYAARARAFVGGAELAAAHAAGAALVREWRAGAPEALRAAKPAILFVHHDGAGGTPLTNADLMDRLAEDHETLRLRGDGRTYRLDRREAGVFTPMREAVLPKAIPSASLGDAAYRAVVQEILRRESVEVVHVRHLFQHDRDLLKIAKEDGLRTVFSLHDFYAVCPNTHLINAEERHCAGDCAGGEADCDFAPLWVGGPARLRDVGVKVWREEFTDRVWPFADVVVTTSPAAAALHGRIFDKAVADLCVIEHGRDLTPVNAARPPRTDQPVRVLVLGALTAHKGGRVIKALKRIKGAERYEFHVLGRVWPEFAGAVVDHGAYERDAMTARIEDIKPSVGVVASLWPETYCHTLSELWTHGIPTAVSDLGALAERTHASGAGVIFRAGDPRALLEALETLADPPIWARHAANARAYRPRTAQQMADDYRRLYQPAATASRIGS